MSVIISSKQLTSIAIAWKLLYDTFDRPGQGHGMLGHGHDGTHFTGTGAAVSPPTGTGRLHGWRVPHASQPMHVQLTNQPTEVDRGFCVGPCRSPRHLMPLLAMRSRPMGFLPSKVSSLPDVIFEHGHKHGNDISVQCWHRAKGITSSCTYSEFAFNMQRAGAWLKVHNLQEGHFCAILAQNSLAYLYVSFGAFV